MGFSDIAASLKARVRFHRLRFGNAHARLASDRVFAAGQCNERAAHEPGIYSATMRPVAWWLKSSTKA